MRKNIEEIDYIFDLATLTGASIGAFGGYTTAVMGYSEKLKKKISKASKKSGELVGFLPFNDYLEKFLDSEIADFKNSNSNKNGAAITASLFLSKFIEEKNKKNGFILILQVHHTDKKLGDIILMAQRELLLDYFLNLWKI